MGTPDFAVASLRALIEGGYTVVGVVTMPDKPIGRHGSILQPSAVKQYATAQGLPILQPEKLKDEHFLAELRNWQADLQIVVAFRMLPEIVWEMPRFGAFNLHASLLPQYRGAAPINWAIINDEKETGVTTFFLTHGMDTGRIILQRKWPIAKTDNAGDVHDALMSLGAETVTETVDRLIENEGIIETTSQEELLETMPLHPAPKIFNDTCRINWHQPLAYIYNYIRGLSPYPAAWTELISPSGVSTTIKIFSSEKILHQHNLELGTILTDGNKYLLSLQKTDSYSNQNLDIAVKDGFIRILSLQLAGKKRMPVKDFLNGTNIDSSWMAC